MSFQTIINNYLYNIRKTHTEPNTSAELSLHRHLIDLLEATVTFFGHDLTIIHEPQKIPNIGKPDFIVQDGLLPVGYVEAEAFGTNLDKLTGHAKTQNDRFIENLDNFILTNFVEFRLYADGELQAKAQLTDVTENRGTQNLIKTNPLEVLLNRFLKRHPVYLTTPEALAKYLARRTRELQIQIEMALANEQSDIYGMYKGFQEILIFTLTPMILPICTHRRLLMDSSPHDAHYLTALTFLDLLLLANFPAQILFCENSSTKLLLPDFDSNITWVLDDIVNLLRNVPKEALSTAFTVQTPKADPAIHFYETFLEEYDAKRRVDRGVYYTPQPIISYIVRSVDALLKKELGKADGLADSTALILDPATGTEVSLLKPSGIFIVTLQIHTAGDLGKSM